MLLIFGSLDDNKTKEGKIATKKNSNLIIQKSVLQIHTHCTVICAWVQTKLLVLNTNWHHECEKKKWVFVV